MHKEKVRKDTKCEALIAWSFHNAHLRDHGRLTGGKVHTRTLSSRKVYIVDLQPVTFSDHVGQFAVESPIFINSKLSTANCQQCVSSTLIFVSRNDMDTRSQTLTERNVFCRHI